MASLQKIEQINIKTTMSIIYKKNKEFPMNIPYLTFQSDGIIRYEGYDTNGDGMIDIMIPVSSSRWRYVEKTKPFYARNGFDWNDTSKWITNQNAINYYLTYINPSAESKYPDNFESKTY